MGDRLRRRESSRKAIVRCTCYRLGVNWTSITDGRGSIGYAFNRVSEDTFDINSVERPQHKPWVGIVPEGLIPILWCHNSRHIVRFRLN